MKSHDYHMAPLQSHTSITCKEISGWAMSHEGLETDSGERLVAVPITDHEPESVATIIIYKQRSKRLTCLLYTVSYIGGRCMISGLDYNAIGTN